MTPPSCRQPCLLFMRCCADPLRPTASGAEFGPAKGPVGYSEAKSSSDDEGAERIARDQETSLDQLEVALELPILMLDRNHPVVAGRVQRADETVPAHLAQPR